MPNANEYVVTPVVGPDPDNWVPNVGQETLQFLKRVGLGEGSVSVGESAVSILARGISPHGQSGHATGLVVGYVQSGKTMSFEAVAALAHDNGFPLVIVIGGSSLPLLEQSTKRLCRDLGLDESNRTRSWQHFKNPGEDDFRSVRNALDAWNDSRTPQQYRQTVLVTVLKHHRRLRDLSQILGRLQLERHRTPTLVIDDEADQASLNIGTSRGDSSTTYDCLMELRDAIPNHTYLQYTATPQAPLLISIIDSLSPDFVHVLHPGSAYIGGSQFFADDHRYLRRIPNADLPSKDEPLHEPPDSLLAALRVFMIGVVIGLKNHDNTGNRSMLVHPSHLTIQHQVYLGWVRKIFDSWGKILSDLEQSDPDRMQLIDDFRGAYSDLEKTAQKMPPFETVADSLHFAFRNTQVLEVNTRTGSTRQVDWRNTYGMILVGGQAMDRGFTVEGLTVTYMPRGIGVGNADTIQQRGRFFGYKKSYLEYCRIYLHQDTIDAYKHYVEHEEFMRGQLIEVQKRNRHLDEWKRMFVLDRALRPCRRQVLEFDYVRDRFADSWIFPNMVGDPASIIVANRRVVDQFLGRIKMTADSGHKDRTSQQIHRVCNDISLEYVLEHLLTGIRTTDVEDSQTNTMLLAHLGRVLDRQPIERCSVFLMSGGKARIRSVNSNGKVKELFQGAYPVTPRRRRGEVYLGDRYIRNDDQVTIQIHRLTLKKEDQVVASDVISVAVWLPTRLAQDWIYQEQRVPKP